MMLNYLLTSILAFSLGILGVFVALKFFPKISLLDNPKKFGFRRMPVPYSVGILIFSIFLSMVLFLIPWSIKIATILIALGILVLVSFFDDLFGLSPYFRLAIQILCAGIVIYGGTKIDFLAIPFFEGIDFTQIIWFGLPIAGIILTIVWIVFVTNMMNWIDGIDGLSSGITLISMLAFFVLGIRPGFHTIDQSLVLYLSAILFGAILPFWFLEKYPARLLLGDSGTMFFGFMIAILSIVSGGKLATAFLVLALPLLDGFFVIIQRILAKKSPFSGDFTHFHHRLLQLKLSPKKVLWIYYGLTLFFGLIAIYFGSKEKLIAAIFLLAIIGILEIFLSRKIC